MQRVFGFRSVMLNYLKGCPREGVRERYYGLVVNSILKEYRQVREAAMAEEFLSKIALNGLVDVLSKDQELGKVEGLMDDIFASIHRESYLVHFVKSGIYLAEIGQNLRQQDLVKLDI
jgi:hypothetical protein